MSTATRGHRATVGIRQRHLLVGRSQHPLLDRCQLRHLLLADRLKLNKRGLRDFLDGLVALGMLTRSEGRYANTPETSLFLDRGKPSYVGGLLEMANARLYPFWSGLTEALRTGEPQNEAKQGRDLFDELYKDPQRLAAFLRAMDGPEPRYGGRHC